MIQMQSNPRRRRPIPAPVGSSAIKVLGGSKRKYAGIGDVIVVSVRTRFRVAASRKGDGSGRLSWRTAREIRRATARRSVSTATGGFDQQAG